LKTPVERLMYKPFNIIDLTASQLTNTPSIDGTIEELEGVLNRRLTLPEAQVNMILRIIYLAAFFAINFFSI